ncbi:TPA_asm: major head protein, DJR fold [dsDNA virus vir530]|nr:TPA_asm: major head protein, DJR fold [dsDNA virus vir530]
MVKLEQSVIMSREAQSSDTALFRKDLPKAGAYSALDIGIRVTNGATSCINKDILSLIKKIGLVFNGNESRFYISGQDFFRHYWMKHGRPMPYLWSEAASGVQEVWFRMEFGRFLGDPMYGLNLDRFNNVQVQIDYDMTVNGAIAVTTYTTGTFTITLIAHQFPYAARPVFRGMIGLREFWNGTSLASGDEIQDLPSSNPLLAVSVAAREDSVDEATDITDIMIGKDLFSTRWVEGKWYNFQQMQNADLDVREETFDLLLTTAAVKYAHLANIKTAAITARSLTLGAA